MSILTVIPFGKDGTSGDSAFSVDTSFPYHSEMTLKELQTLTYEYFMKEWGDDAADYESMEEWAKETDMEVVGGWVILTDFLKFINVDCLCGGDSAAYAVANLMKEQVKKASNLLVE